jgi:hypothetical protein
MSSSNHSDDNFIITSTSPFKSDNLDSIKPKKIYAYSIKKINNKLSTFTTYKGYPSTNKRKYNNTYKSIFNRIDINSTKNLKNIFPKICLNSDKTKNKTKFDKFNKTENKKYLYSSIFKIAKTYKNKSSIKKEHLYFMKEKKSEIHNIHKKIMRNNKMHILLKQSTDINVKGDKDDNKKVNNNKLSYISLTEENKASFEKEYDKICKNKLKAKKLIEKEINNVGRQFSWIKKFRKNEELERMKDNYGKKSIKTNKATSTSEFSKRMRGMDPTLQINQTSSFPMLAFDSKLISKLWKIDMIKYYKYVLDTDKTKDKKMLNDLLDVYY